jgi:hypothetical protein
VNCRTAFDILKLHKAGGMIKRNNSGIEKLMKASKKLVLTQLRFRMSGVVAPSLIYSRQFLELVCLEEIVYLRPVVAIDAYLLPE